ncbi:MAG: hypothetical protein U0792_03405 [Gemmataceae bacterium]
MRLCGKAYVFRPAAFTNHADYGERRARLQDETWFPCQPATIRPPPTLRMVSRMSIKANPAATENSVTAAAVLNSGKEQELKQFGVVHLLHEFG